MVDNQESCLLYLSRSGGQSVRIVHAKRELTICTWSHTHTHQHTPTHTHIHTHTHQHTHKHTHLSYMYPNVHLTNTQCSTYHLHTHTRTPTHTHTHPPTHTHTHMHTHTHTHRWYHPGISRHIAESMFMSREISYGTYLLRDSLTNTDSLTLSVR